MLRRLAAWMAGESNEADKLRVERRQLRRRLADETRSSTKRGETVESLRQELHDVREELRAARFQIERHEATIDVLKMSNEALQLEYAKANERHKMEAAVYVARRQAALRGQQLPEFEL